LQDIFTAKMNIINFNLTILIVFAILFDCCSADWSYKGNHGKTLNFDTIDDEMKGEGNILFDWLTLLERNLFWDHVYFTKHLGNLEFDINFWLHGH